MNNVPYIFTLLSKFSYYKYMFDALIITIYGWGRCQATYEQLQSANVSHNPFYDLHLSMQKVNVTFGQVTPMVEYYLGSRHVKDELIDEVVNNLKRVESAANELFTRHDNSTQVDGSLNYIMSHFNLQDSDYLHSIIITFIFVLVFRLGAFALLYMRSCRRR